MRARQIASLTPWPRQALDHLYRTTKTPRLRTRAPRVWLSVAQGRTGPQIAAIVRESEATGRRWLKRSRAEGSDGVQDAPRPGRPSEVPEGDRAAWLAAVRRHPRGLGLPFSRWTRHRLVDYRAEQTGVRVSDETVRRALKHAGLGRSRPQQQISSPAPDSAGTNRRWQRPVII